MAGRGILSRALPPLIRERCLHGAGRSRRIAFGSIRIMGYLWVKAFHIVFVASWFAGLFYLPRIYVNLAMVPPGSDAECARLLLMAHKLMRFTHMLMVPAVGTLGSVLLLGERPTPSDWIGLALVVAASGSIMLPARRERGPRSD